MTSTDQSRGAHGEDADSGFHRKMTFGEHLEELRSRLLRATLVVAAVFVVCLVFNDAVVRLVLHPFFLARDRMGAAGNGLKLSFIEPTEGFFFEMNAALFASLLVGMPYVLHQMWQFVAAGLYPKEKHAITRFLPLSVGLFLVGAAFSYFWLLPIALSFLLGVGDPEVMVASLRPESYFGFFLLMCVLLGVVFQLPLVQFVLARFGIVSVGLQRKYRRHFILGSVIAAAVLTPTGDAVSLAMVSVPMMILYEIGLLFAARRPAKSAESA